MTEKCAGHTKDILDAFELYLSKNDKSHNTIKTYLGVIQAFSNWLETQGKSLSTLNGEDIQGYISYLEKDRNTATINKIFNTLNSFTTSIQKSNLMDGVTRNTIKLEKQPLEYLNEQQVESLLKQVNQDTNKRNIVIVYLLLCTGVRVSELCALDKKDVYLNDNSLVGQLVIRNERKHERVIPLTKELATHLHDYLRTRDDEDEALFLSNYQKRIAQRTVQHMLKEQYGVYAHKLRHTFCIDLLRKGIDVSIVAQLSGHSDLTIIKDYLEIINNEKK